MEDDSVATRAHPQRRTRSMGALVRSRARALMRSCAHALMRVHRSHEVDGHEVRSRVGVALGRDSSRDDSAARLVMLTLDDDETSATTRRPGALASRGVPQPARRQMGGDQRNASLLFLPAPWREPRRLRSTARSTMSPQSRRFWLESHDTVLVAEPAPRRPAGAAGQAGASPRRPLLTVDRRSAAIRGCLLSWESRCRSTREEVAFATAPPRARCPDTRGPPSVTNALGRRGAHSRQTSRSSKDHAPSSRHAALRLLFQRCSLAASLGNASGD